MPTNVLCENCKWYKNSFDVGTPGSGSCDHPYNLIESAIEGDKFRRDKTTDVRNVNGRCRDFEAK